VRWGRHAGGARSRMAAEAGLTWPLPAELPDEESSPPSSAPASKCWLMLTTMRFGPTRTGPRLDLAQTPIISSANGRAAWGPETSQPTTTVPAGNSGVLGASTGANNTFARSRSATTRALPRRSATGVCISCMGAPACADSTRRSWSRPHAQLTNSGGLHRRFVRV
jgi:hypothetical protein